MFCLSGFIQFDGIGGKICAEHHELNSSSHMGGIAIIENRSEYLPYYL